MVHGTPETLATFEQALFGPFTVILQQDIDRTCASLFAFSIYTIALCRIHSVRVPNTRADAVVAHHRRADRIPRIVALFAHPRVLATKGEHSGSRQITAGISGARCPRDGKSRSVGAGVGDRTAAIGAEQDERRMGVRVTGGRGASRGSVSAMYWDDESR